MDSLLHAFGIDAKLIVIQIINFVVLMVLLSYFLYKPVLKMLADREDKIAQGLKDAELAGKAKESAEEEKQHILSEAHQEADKVAERAKTHAEEKRSAIVAEAEAKAEDIVSKAEEAGLEIKNRFTKESESEIARLSVLAAEKVLKERG